MARERLARSAAQRGRPGFRIRARFRARVRARVRVRVRVRVGVRVRGLELGFSQG